MTKRLILVSVSIGRIRIIKCNSNAGFYPVELKYSSNNILCKIDVLKVLDADINNDPVKFACDKKTIVDKYEVV